MKSCKLPIEIQENVHEYYHLTFKDGQIFGNNVLDELTPQLRRQIVVGWSSSSNTQALTLPVPPLLSSPLYDSTASLTHHHLAPTVPPPYTPIPGV